jgi:hypothetical protein
VLSPNPLDPKINLNVFSMHYLSIFVDGLRSKIKFIRRKKIKRFPKSIKHPSSKSNLESLTKEIFKQYLIKKIKKCFQKEKNR